MNIKTTQIEQKVHEIKEEINHKKGNESEYTCRKQCVKTIRKFNKTNSEENPKRNK